MDGYRIESIHVYGDVPDRDVYAIQELYHHSKGCACLVLFTVYGYITYRVPTHQSPTRLQPDLRVTCWSYRFIMMTGSPTTHNFPPMLWCLKQYSENLFSNMISSHTFIIWNNLILWICVQYSNQFGHVHLMPKFWSSFMPSSGM